MMKQQKTKTQNSKNHEIFQNAKENTFHYVIQVKDRFAR